MTPAQRADVIAEWHAMHLRKHIIDAIHQEHAEGEAAHIAIARVRQLLTALADIQLPAELSTLIYAVHDALAAYDQVVARGKEQL